MTRTTAKLGQLDCSGVKSDDRRAVHAERRDTHESRDPYQCVCETRWRGVGGAAATAPATAPDPAARPTPTATTARPTPGTTALAAPVSSTAPRLRMDR